MFNLLNYGMFMTNQMTKDEIRREKVLSGNVWKMVIYIAYPILIYNFLSAFYSIFDAMIVSSISVESVSAVAALNQIKNVLSTLGLAISAGGSIVVARNIGAGDYDRAKKSANVLVTLSLIIVLSIVLVSIANAYNIMKYSGVNEDLIAIGYGYFIVGIVDVGFMFFNNIFMGLQKANANSKIVFIANVTGMVIKFSLSLYFVYGLKVDNIVWVSFATLTSNIVIFIMCLSLLMKKSHILRLSFKSFSLDKIIVKQIVKISLPIFIGKFVFSYGKVIINAMSAEYGSLVVGAVSVSGSMSAIIARPANSFEEIESGLVSQNLGNRNIKRTFKIFKTTFIYNFTFSILGYILIKYVLIDDLLWLFTQNQHDANSADFLVLVKSVFYFDSWSILATAINAAVLGLLYGFGQTYLAMILNFSRIFIFRVPILWYLQHFHKEMGAECVGLSMGISNLAIAFISFVFFFIFYLKIKKKGFDGMYL